LGGRREERAYSENVLIDRWVGGVKFGRVECNNTCRVKGGKKDIRRCRG